MIPRHLVPLDSVCNVEYGTRVVQKHDGGSIYPVYGGGGATFKMDSFNRENRLVVARFAMSEECTRFVSGCFYLNDSGLTVSPKSESLIPRFLDYQLLANNEKIYALGKGSAQRNLDVPAFRQLPIFVPKDVESQLKTVAILDAAFTEIETAKANAAKNLQNAHDLFESYLRSVFAERGTGWKTVPLGEMVTFRNGINFTKSSQGTPIKILGVKDFRNYYWAPLEDLDSIVPEGVVPDVDTLREGDIVFVRSNGNPDLIGRCLLIGEISERTTHSGFTIKARLHSNEVMPAYLCHFLKSKSARQEMIDGGNGANIKSLNQGTLSRIVVPFPSLSMQAEIVRQLEKMKSETQRLECISQQKLAVLDELKKSFLQQAFADA